MLTTKNWAATALIFLAWLAVTGCAPSGTRAFNEGRELMEGGRLQEALFELQRATALMPTNAVVWNHLGLAYHRSGDSTNAEQAYLKALSLDRNLAEAHFNLGFLRFENERYEPARTAWVAYTSLRSNVPEGWLRLGIAHMRLREYPAAEKCFDEVLQLEGGNPAAINNLGILAALRRDYRRAAALFSQVLQQRTDYAPALLNLAILNHTQLNNRSAALDLYRQYLAIPGAAHADPVQEWVSVIEREIAPTVASEVPTVERSSEPPVQRSNPPSNAAVTPADSRQTVARTPTVGAQTDSRRPSSGGTRTGADAESTRPVAAARPTATRTNEPGFLQRVNPLRVFRDRNGSRDGESGRESTAGRSVDQIPGTERFPRYGYRKPAKPRAGDTAAAERSFQLGARAHQSLDWAEAIRAYREAIRLDPAYFEAHYNLASASAASGNVSQALAAYETALALRPESLDARFNFALALKQANYVGDSIRELEAILSRYPREARVHILLGNIYSQQLKQNDKARTHYSRALELDSRHPQAASIRLWLNSN